MQEVAREFFALPLEEKQKYSVKTERQTLGSQGYGSKFKSLEGKASDWGDQLRHRTLPLSARQYELWPTDPLAYRYAHHTVGHQDALYAQIFLVQMKEIPLQEKRVQTNLEPMQRFLLYMDISKRL